MELDKYKALPYCSLALVNQQQKLNIIQTIHSLRKDFLVKLDLSPYLRGIRV